MDRSTGCFVAVEPATLASKRRTHATLNRERPVRSASETPCRPVAHRSKASPKPIRAVASNLPGRISCTILASTLASAMPALFHRRPKQIGKRISKYPHGRIGILLPILTGRQFVIVPLAILHIIGVIKAELLPSGRSQSSRRVRAAAGVGQVRESKFHVGHESSEGVLIFPRCRMLKQQGASKKNIKGLAIKHALHGTNPVKIHTGHRAFQRYLHPGVLNGRTALADRQRDLRRLISRPQYAKRNFDKTIEMIEATDDVAPCSANPDPEARCLPVASPQ